MAGVRLKGGDTGGTLEPTREKCGVGISGDRRIRARVLARATAAGRPPLCLGGS